MHVTYVLIGISFLLKRCSNRKAKYFCIIFLLFFAQFVGSTPSILRAAIMSILAIISKLFFRKSDILNNISISCLIIIILNPYNIFNLGFQLSFLGTLGIVLFNENIMKVFNKNYGFIVDRICSKSFIKKINCIKYKLNRVKKNINILNSIKKIISVSISANILIFPVIIYQHNNISFIFLISNILVTPILGLMSCMGYITCIISLFSLKIAKIFAIIFENILNVFENIAHFSSNLSLLKITVITPNFIFIISIYFLVFYIKFYSKSIVNKYFNITKFISSILILIIILSFFRVRNPYLKMYFVDVGQGDSTLIITSTNKTILIDGGGSEFGNYDVGESVLVPYLLDRKIKSIDYIIFSHFDSDHCKGLFSVMENLKVKNVVISKQGEYSENFNYFVKLAENKNINIIVVQAGHRLIIDKYTYFDILWPTNNLVNTNILNNNSVVCKLNYMNTSILFTGDIEAIAEKELLNIYSNNELEADILKVAHHGSKTSSIQEFVNIVNPKISIIGVGKNNKFNHPSNEIIKRFELNKVQILRTDIMGEICIQIKKNGKIRIDKKIK